MAFNGTKITEYKNGRDAATGTPALGTTFNNEFDRLYENDNHLNDTKLDKAGGSVTGNLEVQGNLTVQGDTVQINVTEVNAEDKVVTLNYGETGPGVSGDGLSGIEVDRGISQDKARLVFDESDDDFKAGLGSVLLPLLRLLAGNKVALDELIEKTLDHGITIDGVLLIDGAVIQSNRVTVTTATQQMANNREYLVNYTGGRCTLTLPTTSNIGDTIKIRDIGVYGWKIAQNAGQNIIVKGKSTVVGITGFVESISKYSNIEIECIVANTSWQTTVLYDNFILKGFILGGNAGGTFSTIIEDLNFTTEASSAISTTLSAGRTAGAGVSGNIKGYCLGGNISSGTRTAIIESLNFTIQKSEVLTATLDTAKDGGAGVSGNLKGYCMGGYTGSATAVIEDLNFSSESSAAITATLDAGTRAGAGVSGTSKGYIMGGVSTGYTTKIEDLNFTTEASATITATLDTPKWQLTGVSGNLKGYCMGGTGSSDTAVIEDLNFSSETSSAIAATLDTAKSRGAGVSGDAKGYCMGGLTSSTTIAVIEDLNFTTEASVVIAATLDTAKNEGIGLQDK